MVVSKKLKIVLVIVIFLWQTSSFAMEQQNNSPWHEIPKELMHTILLYLVGSSSHPEEIIIGIRSMNALDKNTHKKVSFYLDQDFIEQMQGQLMKQFNHTYPAVRPMVVYDFIKILISPNSLLRHPPQIFESPEAHLKACVNLACEGNSHPKTAQFFFLQCPDDEKNISFLCSVKQNNHTMTTFCLNHGANVDCHDYSDLKNRTALMHASEQGYEDMVTLLLQSGASKDIQICDYQDKKPKTALDFAQGNGHNTIVKLLTNS